MPSDNHRWRYEGTLEGATKVRSKLAPREIQRGQQNKDQAETGKEDTTAIDDRPLPPNHICTC